MLLTNTNIIKGPTRGIIPSPHEQCHNIRMRGSLNFIRLEIKTSAHLFIVGIYKKRLPLRKRKAHLPYYPSITRVRFAISIAAAAASQPLLPALVPARSMACSIFSVVRTPKIIGIPVCNVSDDTPFATSLHT